MNTTTSTEAVSSHEEPASKCRDIKERSVRLVRKNPVGAVFSALAVGFAIGLLIHRREPSWRERYIDLPTGKLKGWFNNAVEKSTDALGDYRDRSTEVAKDTASAVRRGLGKLRFW